MVEILIFLLATTILLAASVPMITKKYKNVPKRLNHGRYVCYRDANNKLWEIKYNAKKQIFNQEVTSCTFEQPQNTAMLKVQIIGSGAGGTQHFEVNEYLNSPVESTFVPGSGWTDGNRPSWAPTEEEFKEWYDGETFTLTASTGKAGDGNFVNLSFASPEDIKCSGTPTEGVVDGNDLDTRWGLFRDKINEHWNPNIEGLIGYIYAGESDSDIVAGICKDNALGDGAEGVSYKTYTDVNRANLPATLSARYKLDFSTKENGFEGYLAGLQIHQNGSYNGGFSNDAVKSGGSGATMSGYQGRFCENNKCVGDLPDSTAAVQFQGITAYATDKPCPGGEIVVTNPGGYYKLASSVPFDHTLSCVEDPKDSGVASLGSADYVSFVGAELIEPSSSTSGSGIKTITTVNELNKKDHKLGDAGNAGQAKTLYIPKLSGKCEITIPHGGKIWDNPTNSPAPVVGNTVIKCTNPDDPTLNKTIEALGGTYKQFTTKEYDASVIANGGNIITAPEIGGETPFVEEFFLKYGMPEGFVPGQGGNGSGLTDGCVHLWGNYSHTANGGPLVPGGSNTSVSFEEPAPSCVTEKTQITSTTAPTPGMGGAVIISW